MPAKVEAALRPIHTLPIFEPLLHPARYKGAFGGRGSGKSHFFAEMMVEDCVNQPGLRGVCIREVQKTLKQSAKRLIEDKIVAMGVGHLFEVQASQIKTPGGGVIIFQGMQDHTAESIKSLEGFNRAWVEEAQTLSERSLELLRPTIRAEGSEIWFSWNPRRKTDAVDAFLRKDNNPPPGAIVVVANFYDNRWFPEVLRQEMLLDYERDPERADHIWGGDYVKVWKGAYFAKGLTEVRRQERITKRLAADPVIQLRAYFDIGGSGASADAMAIWIVQFVGEEIHVLDYIEGQGQVLGYYATELRRRGWGDAQVILPHDGVNANNVTGKRYRDHWTDAGFDTRVVENTGKGAAMMRVEAVRRILPRCQFDEKRSAAGLDVLGAYHEKRDEARNIGLGPEHDWSSHGADAFGLMAIDYEKPVMRDMPIRVPPFGAV